jgi:arsenate reductase
MSEITIYHNPRCSKSRQTLALLEERGVSPEVILYLETPPTEAKLKDILAKLGIPPRELMRKGEAEYKDNNFKDSSLSDADLLAAMVKFPKLIERPIVVKGNKAKIGRPPESVLELLN